MPASVTALQQLRDSATALQQPPRFNNCASAAAAAVQQLRFSNCRDSATAAVQQLRLSMVQCDLGPEHSCPNLMTPMVYCDLGPGHPCPKPNDVHGLGRFGKRATLSNT